MNDEAQAEMQDQGRLQNSQENQGRSRDGVAPEVPARGANERAEGSDEQPVDERLQTPQSEGVHWRFTINFAGANGRAERDARWETLRGELDVLHGSGDVVYAVCGKEVGAAGTPHIQGHIRFKKKKRFGAAKKCIDPRAWIANSRFPDQSVQYCKKDGEYFEIGEWTKSNQGQRTDLEAAKRTLDGGASLKEFQDAHFKEWCKYGRNIEGYMKTHSKKRQHDDEVQVHWYWGDAGTGKTYRVHQLENAFEEPERLWIAIDNTFKWFDGYDGHEAVLFDDFDRIDPDYLSVFKKCLDRYNYRVQVKGGSTVWIPKRIYFTSNRDLEDVINELPECHRQAIRRRFAKVEHFVDLMQHQ